MISIHDNIIKSYIVDLENKLINFRTFSRERLENVDISFKDVLAHKFYDELEGSIIFDIKTQNIDKFIEQNKELLQLKKAYNWPTSFSDFVELERVLSLGEYKCYVLSSSYGLNGWILAKELKE